MEKMMANSLLFFSLVLLPLFQRPALCANILSLSGLGDEEEPGYNYVKGSGKGPEDWWHLNKDWKTCRTGNRQSPINLTFPIQKNPTLGTLRFFHRSSPAVLENKVHDVMLTWKEDAGILQIDGVDYKLKQLHWHSPAEHKIKGRSLDMEMHVVHQSDDGRIAVIGVLYTYGDPDPFLQQLEKPLRILAKGEQTKVKVGFMSPPIVIDELKSYYRYSGSLTTPPCTERVLWTVFDKVLTVSECQVALLKKVVPEEMKNNSRPIQPRNCRVISQFFPGCEPQEEHASI